MPSALANASQFCQQLRKDGKPCTAVARKGLTYCRGHDPRIKAIRTRAAALALERASVPTPKLCLAELLELDPSTSENLRTLTVGLAQHIAAGTIDHQSASSILRFMSKAAELTPRRRDDSLKSMLSNLLQTKPAADTEEESDDVSRETPPLPPGN